MKIELTHPEVVEIVRILGYTIGALGEIKKHAYMLEQIEMVLQKIGEKEFK